MSYDPNKWHAVAYDEDGYVIANVEERLSDGDEEQWPHRIALATFTAVPRPQSDDPNEEFFRAPSVYTSADLFVEFDTQDLYENEILDRWKQTEAFAAAINKEN